MPLAQQVFRAPTRVVEGFSTTLSAGLTGGVSTSISLTDNIPGYVAFDILDLVINDGTNVEVVTIQGSGATSPYAIHSSYNSFNGQIINTFANGTAVIIGPSAEDHFSLQGAGMATDFGDITTEFDPALFSARAFYRQLDANSTVTTGAPNDAIVINGTTYYMTYTTILVLQQDVVGSRTVTWDASILWAGGTAPTMTATASATDVFRFYKVRTGTASTIIVGEVVAQNIS